MTPVPQQFVLIIAPAKLPEGWEVRLADGRLARLCHAMLPGTYGFVELL